MLPPLELRLLSVGSELDRIVVVTSITDGDAVPLGAVTVETSVVTIPARCEDDLEPLEVLEEEDRDEVEDDSESGESDDVGPAEDAGAAVSASVSAASVSESCSEEACGV